MTDTAGFLVALTTLGSVDDARRLVRSLVDDRLVACGTILEGATSVYRWEGNVTEDREVVVIFKTRLDRWTELAEAVNARHPYDVPELLALPVGSGLEAYLRWVETETTSLEPR
jgi:periplasmic divalent cation tolerance protein